MKRMTDFWKAILGSLLLYVHPSAYAVPGINAPQAHWIFDKIVVPGIIGVQFIAVDEQGKIIVRIPNTIEVFDSQGAQLASWTCLDSTNDNGLGANAGGKIVAWCGADLIVFDEQGNVLAQPVLPSGAACDCGNKVFVNIDGTFSALTNNPDANHHKLVTFSSANSLIASVQVVPPQFSVFTFDSSQFEGFVELNENTYLFTANSYAAGPYVLSADGTTVAGGVISATGVALGLIVTPSAVFDQQYRSLGTLSSLYGGMGGSSASTLSPDGTTLLAVAAGIARFKQVSRSLSANFDLRPNPEATLVDTRTSGGDAVIDIDYLVHDKAAGTVTTAALAFDSDGDTFSSVRQIKTLVEGTASNLGSAIPTEVTKRITWDVNQDLGFAGFATVSVEVLANDNRALIDIPFVEIPAGIPNAGDPDLVISTWPMSESDIKPAWYWLIATSDPRITFNNGQVFGSTSSGAYNGQLLTSDAGTTTQGQSFLCSLLNVRPATQTEINRAQTGTTPGVQSYTPLAQVGPYPAAVNEIGVDVVSTGLWVVKLP